MSGEEVEMKCSWLQDLTLTGGCYVQVGKEVVEFSSQYGSERSISYTAANLAGKESIYPGYGDFTQACVFRTYGKWWKKCPSATPRYRRTPDSFCSDDFIEVVFADKVCPTKVEVFETYNPGCIVKILACDCTSGTDVDTGQVEWVTLWSGKPTYPKQESNVFSPPLKKVNFLSNLIRLELCQELVEYYTELDCIRLHGTRSTNKPNTQVVPDVNNILDEDLNIKLQQLEIKSDSNVSSTQSAVEEESNRVINGSFDCLPGEVINLILQYLDLTDLCHLAQTCRLLEKYCYDPLLYTELNLQPYWTQVRDSTLAGLQSRSSAIQKLNLTWCGKGGILTDSGLQQLLPVCNTNLTGIILSSCKFVDSTTLKLLTQHCPNIAEIDLSNCRKIGNVAMLLLCRFEKLKRMNLYRTLVDMPSVIAVLRSCPLLEHLNLGSCIGIASYDDVLIEIANNCHNLISLDLWQARSLTHIGVKALANKCTKLQELDIGWCPQVKSNTSCLISLLKECRSMKKLFLTANRTVCDNDLRAIAEYAPFMEQIDILGTREVTPAAVLSVLENCRNLIFFDVSFCGGIYDIHIEDWARQFPHVNFKKSFQSGSVGL
ncbi:hypothetical protein LOTGIDRAFT_224605 [Lottia gigantea]|uniref:F-box domain-containing protein n=1 Tax=Lottia gigantea TaxID=225164 RepID=V4AZM6_LOTGI|nr:hypothetical protein LOTGIDRAFT_224605 [Lottia gigantea]ESP03193.1 hypothetical protein LOTGIDRAFT_224605 [Lottia gigantea]